MPFAIQQAGRAMCTSRRAISATDVQNFPRDAILQVYANNERNRRNSHAGKKQTKRARRAEDGLGYHRRPGHASFACANVCYRAQSSPARGNAGMLIAKERALHRTRPSARAERGWFATAAPPGRAVAPPCAAQAAPRASPPLVRGAGGGGRTTEGRRGLESVHPAPPVPSNFLLD